MYKISIKIDRNINNLYYLYDGNIINDLELKYKELKSRNDEKKE